MKREIKFRAWHKLDGYMILPEQCEKFEINFTPKCFKGFSFWIKFKGSGELLGSDKHIDLMQYTGLKDKNGIEIYEGDIVKYERKCYDKEEVYTVDVINEVIFMFGSFKHRDSQYGWEGEGLIPLDECEVIGNIHQNPELIK